MLSRKTKRKNKKTSDNHTIEENKNKLPTQMEVYDNQIERSKKQINKDKREILKKRKGKDNKQKNQLLSGIKIPSWKNLSYSNIDINDLELINKIDKPKRKKKLKDGLNKQNDIISREKSELFKVKLAEFLPIYDIMMRRIVKVKDHCFMKDNFPQMYNIENFYLHIKLNLERKNKKIGSLEFDSKTQTKSVENLEIRNLTQEKNLNSSDEKDKVLLNEKNHFDEIPNNTNINTKCKKVWDCNKCDTIEVDEYLINVAKIWPVYNYIWSQEVALEFLFKNDFNKENTLKMVLGCSSEFISFLDEKCLIQNKDTRNQCNQKDTISSKVSKELRVKKLKIFH